MRIPMSDVFPSGIPSSINTPGGLGFFGNVSLDSSVTPAGPDAAAAAGYNPAQYLSPSDAAALAAQLGGTVTSTAVAGGPGGPPPQAMIDLGNGTVVNAGLVNRNIQLYGKQQALTMLAAEQAYQPAVGPAPGDCSSFPGYVWIPARSSCGPPYMLPYASPYMPAGSPATNCASGYNLDSSSGYCLVPGVSGAGLKAPSSGGAGGAGASVAAPVTTRNQVSQQQQPGQSPTTVQGSSLVPDFTGGGGSGGGAVSSNWLTQSMIGGVPNWFVLAGAGVAVFLFMDANKRG